MTSTVVLGLLVGFVSLAVPSINMSTAEVAQSEDDQSNDQRAELSIQAFDAINSIAQVSLDHSFFLIDILPEMEEVEDEFDVSQDATTAGSKVLKILFSRIISPNAP
ncbi:MAG: hypothetical protein RIC35_16500 [Marinoscillum sp.]